MNKVKLWQDKLLQVRRFQPGLESIFKEAPFLGLSALPATSKGCVQSWCRKAWRPVPGSYGPGMAAVLGQRQRKVGRPMWIPLKTFDLRDFGFQEVVLDRTTEAGFVGYSG